MSVVSLIENIDTRTIFGEWLFYFASIFAEMERNSIIERTKAGIKFAREQGVRIGRPPKMTEDKGRLDGKKNSREIRHITVKYICLFS